MTDHSSPANADMSALAANLEGYAHKCVHIGSPESVGDLLDAAEFIRSSIRAKEPYRFASGLTSDDPFASADREEAARMIYDAFPYDGTGTKPQWIPGGNSLMQDTARRAADEVLALRIRAQCVPWQPIATAPKDGTRILVCRDDRFPRNTYVVRWLKDVWNVGPIGGEWHAYPTHWMPIPAGPSFTSPGCKS